MGAESADSRRVTIDLTEDEALVLYDFLARGQGSDDDYSAIEDQAELRVLWDVLATLESTLEAPMAGDYAQRLADARDAVRDSTD